MNSRIKIILIFGVVLLLCGVAASAAAYVSGGMKTVIVWPDGPTVVNPDNERQIDKVDQTFTSVSAITIEAGAIKRIVVKEGQDVSVKGQNLSIFGGLKATTGADGALTVAPSKERKGFYGIIDFPNFFRVGAETFYPSFVEVTAPRGASLSAITIQINSGDVTITDATAERIAVDLSAGNLLADNLTCDSLQISLSYGDINLANIDAQDAVFASATGNIDVSRLSASEGLTLKSSYGDVTLRAISAAAAEFDLSSGDFTAEGVSVSGGMTLRSDYGNVALDTVSAATSIFDLSSGDFTAEGVLVSGGMTLRSSYGDVTWRGDLRGDNAVEMSSGNIDLTLDGAEDDYFITAEVSSGDIAIGRGSRSFSGNGYVERGAQSSPNHIKIRSGYGDARVGFRR
jgi:DUF4097 and DUF4098 domain-containing protein YvlB